MSYEIRRTILQYIQQEQALLSQLGELEKTRTEPASEIGKIAVSEVGGLFLGEITGSGRAARYGRRIGRALADQAQTERLQSHQRAVATQHEFILGSIRNYLSTISETRKTLRGPNSDKLIRKVDRAQNFVKPRTRIRRTIVALQNVASKDLILNSKIPKRVAEKKPQRKTEKEPYVTLKELETKIRQCIQTKLEAISPNWWRERISNDVKQNAESRKNRNEKPWPWLEKRDYPPIYYVDFTDYIKMIRRKDNWRQVFQPLFRDPEVLSAKLKELEPIRNAIAHNRELTRREKTRLELLASDLISCIEG